jgi:hypothetical protein
MYLNPYYVAKVYYGYLKTNVTFFASIKEWPFLPSYVMLCWWNSKCLPKCLGLVGWSCQNIVHYVTFNGLSIWSC